MQVFKGEDYKDVIGATSDDYGKYFSNTSPFYDEKWSPFNLGIYMDRQDDKPKASKYIGVMPALDRNADQMEMFGEEFPEPSQKVFHRFPYFGFPQFSLFRCHHYF